MRSKKIPPVHPGEILLKEFLIRMGLAKTGWVAPWAFRLGA